MRRLNNFKRIIAFALVGLLVVSVASCMPADTDSESTNGINTSTTEGGTDKETDSNTSNKAESNSSASESESLDINESEGSSGSATTDTSDSESHDSTDGDTGDSSTSESQDSTDSEIGDSSVSESHDSTDGETGDSSTSESQDSTDRGTDDSTATEGGETTTHPTEETTAQGGGNVEITYETITIKSNTDTSTILKNGSILKINCAYACVEGIKEKSFSDGLLPYENDGNIMIPVSFLNEKLGLNIPDPTGVGNRCVDANEIYKYGACVFYDQDLGIAVLTDKQLKFIDGSLMSEFAHDASNLFVSGINAPSAAMTGNRPVLFDTDEMLAYSKEMADAGIEPWASSWRTTLAKADADLIFGAKPYTDSNCQEYRFAACNDFINARYLALAYYNTQDTKYLDAALSFLKTYAESDPMLGTGEHLDYSAAKINGKSDIGLNVGLPLTTACEVYALIYPYVSDADKTIIENWIRIEADLVIEGHEYWIVNDYYDQQYGNNHLTCHLMAIISAAYVLEDDDLLSYAIKGTDTNPKYFSEMIESAILMYGDDTWGGDPGDPNPDFDDGEIYDRYRVVQQKGFGYALYHLKFLTLCANVLYNNGVDYFIFYGENGENLLLPYLTYAEYLLDYENITDKNGIATEGFYEGSPIDLGDALNLYLIGYYHYEDETIAEVITKINDLGIGFKDVELFGSSTAYTYGKVIPE